MSVHINAKKGDIAEVVLMPGDPLRAKYIAEHFLEDAKEVTHVRNVLGFTGTYNGKRVSVVASGMGIPSIGIYAYELFHEYGAKKIIRIGTCGAYSDLLRLKDIIVVDEAYTDSNFAYNFNGEKLDHITGTQELANNLIETAKDNNIKYTKGNIISSEVFYSNNPIDYDYLHKNKILAVEMEAFALFYLAKCLKKEAACILTVSDCIYPNDFGILTSEEREQSLNEMIKIALDSITK